jgi:hypothetical protein
MTPLRRVTLTVFRFNDTIRTPGAPSLLDPGNLPLMTSLYSRAEISLISKYSNQILELIDQQDELTRSDLQGCCDAIVMNILREKNSL